MSDETAKLFVAPVYFEFGSVGVVQDVLSAQFGLICLELGFQHLRGGTSAAQSY